MDFYRELILDHYKHPRNFGSLDKFDVRMEERNATCGDKIVMELKFTVHGSRFTVKQIMFSGEGCAISMASASLLTEKVKNMKAGDVLKLKTPDILKMLGTTLTPSRVKCALLPLEVLQKAVVKFEKK